MNQQMTTMNTNTKNFVALKNDLVCAQSNLSLNSTKLIRLAIMQCIRTDDDFKPFEINIKDFASLLGVPKNNMYRDAEKICDELMRQVVTIGDGNPKHKWEKYQWVQHCSYDNGTISIKLHDSLKPYLLGLKNNYTQYELGYILDFKSVYAIRVFELIKMELKSKPIHGLNEQEIYLSVETIRKATDTVNKNKSFSDFHKRVFLVAVNGINKAKNGEFHIDYECKKDGKRIVGYKITVRSANFDKIMSIYNTHPEKVIRTEALKLAVNDYEQGILAEKPTSENIPQCYTDRAAELVSKKRKEYAEKGDKA